MKARTDNTLTPQISVGEIYEGGALNGISIAELIGNEVAIRQVVNEVNSKAGQVTQLSEEVSHLKDAMAELRAKATMRWYDAAFTTVGAIVLAIGTNILSSNLVVAIALMIIGALCILISNIVGVLRTR